MKSYLPMFDWNNGKEVDPFGWLYEEDNNKKVRIVSIRKK